MGRKKASRNKPFQLMYNYMNNVGISKRYRTYKAFPGAIDLLEDMGGGEMRHVPLDELANDVIKLAHNGQDLDIGPADAKPMAHWWVVNNHAEHGLKGLPSPILGKSDEGLCFKRLPFDYKPPGTYEPPEHFLEFCRRASDPVVLQAFIGSIFVAKSYRQQYLYLFGQGSDGKGTLFNLLERLLGQTFVAEDVPDQIAPFWSSGLIGKRLCVFPDLEKPGFPMTPRFRKLTGDDFVRVEEKFKKSYSTKIFTKFIFASNDELQMSGKKADQRRALYVSLDSFQSKAEPSYLEKLWQEAPEIYSLCIDVYKKACPNHEPIMQNITEPIDFEKESYTDAFFDRYFTVNDNGYIKGEEWQRAKTAYFKRRPTANEDRSLIEALKKRGGKRHRTAKGWQVSGITKKSHLTVMHEGSMWP